MAKPDIRSEDLIQIGKWLFEAFCNKHNLPVEQRPGVNPMAFFTWFVQGATKDAVIDADAITADQMVETLHVTQDSANYWMGLADRHDGVNAMMGMWPYMTLSHFPYEHPLKSANLMMVLTWTDGTVVPISVFAHKDVCPDPLRTAEVAAMIGTRAGDLVRQITQNGLDRIHDTHPEHKGLADPRLPEILERMINGCSQSELINHEEAELVGKIGVQIQSMFPAEIPERLIPQLVAAKTAKDRQAAGWQS